MDFEYELEQNGNYQKLSYRKIGKVGSIADQIDTIIKWMEANDLNAGVSRYSRYKGYIKDCDINSERMRRNPNKIMLPDEYNEIFNKTNDAIKELMQIFWIYKFFKDEKSIGFWDRMKKIVSGKDFYDGETDDPARNFLYELLVASWYKEKRLKIDFDSPTKTDVVARRDGKNIYIECKRIKSSKKFEDNYRKACNQLCKVNDDEAVKLAYIDIYNCLTKSLNDYEYSNVRSVNDAVDKKMIEEFEKPNQRSTNKILNEYKDSVDGVVFTTFGTFGINNSIGIETEIVRRGRLCLYKDITDERKYFIKNLLDL